MGKRNEDGTKKSKRKLIIGIVIAFVLLWIGIGVVQYLLATSSPAP